MFREKEFSDTGSYGVETTENRLSQPDLGQSTQNPDEKIVFSRNGTNFLGESDVDREEFRSKLTVLGNSGLTSPNTDQNPEISSDKVVLSEKRLSFLRESGIDLGGLQSKPGDSACQELTLSYLCDNPRAGVPSLKGKRVVLEDLRQEDKWVERDFLQLSDSKNGCSSTREPEQETKGERDSNKKPKVETLGLSLALSLTASNVAPNGEAAVQQKLSNLGCVNTQSLALLNNASNTQTTCSNDFTAASLSCSYSHPFSHNPSCSLTRNSTENYEHSLRSRSRDTDQIWNCGEGTNGSVHSRFKPIGDGVFLSSHGNGVGHAVWTRGRPFNRDSCNSLYREAGSDSSSFFPSELAARPKVDTIYSDSMGRSLDHLRGFDGLEDGRSLNPSRAEKIVRDVLVESIPSMSQLFKEFPNETIESAKKYLNCLISASEKKDQLVELQNLLQCRPEISKETLAKAHKAQLEILVAVKFGLNEFVSGKVHLQTSDLLEIFLCLRCPNVNCKSLLPVDDCDCKICSTKKGFCSQCMCPVCHKFDCANNTCSWVGCDACSHWSHAFCALEKNFIRPGPNLKGSSRITEMQFYCLGCGHASEMFGFVKDVFIYCAKDWGLETLIKELDCVRRIFKGSEDLKGKELYLKAAELITRLERRAMSPSDACNFIIRFFTSKPDKEDVSESPAAHIAAKVSMASQGGSINDRGPVSSPNVTPKSSTFAANMLKSLLPYDISNSTSGPYVSDRQFEDDFSTKLWKRDTSDSLESIVRIKEAEARMFQNRADEARKEVEAYRQLVQARTQKLEEEYAEKLAKLCLPETEERRRKKLEELKIVESSHTDYFNMKIRMQAEISGLLERMEATKQQWAV